jgi:nucleoside-diphosphate-sugar epimerase
LARILVTGAAGFIGRTLSRGLAERGHTVLGMTRGPAEPIPGVELRPIGDIGPYTNWSGHLDGLQIVIHLANRAHQPARNAAATSEAKAAAVLAQSAARTGVYRLVYMSSIRVLGETSLPGAPLRAGDPARPNDPYAQGKLESERALQAVARETGIELVILRPPLVYGPGVKGNFRALLRLIVSRLPLPFAAVDNRRSLIFVENLVDLVSCASLHPGAAGRSLLARDAVDFSTPELIRVLAAGLGCPARLFPFPQPALAALCHLPTLAPLFTRLTLSLQADDAETQAVLGWQPPVSPASVLAATARAFRERS